jgi:hypothetical protein
MAEIAYGDISWERMLHNVEKVRQRLARATAALDAAGIAYAIVGGHAVAAWVSRVDEAAVRNTQDVDILVRRTDLEAITQSLAKVGFVRRHAAGVEMFLDGPQAKARDSLHIVFSAEKVRSDYVVSAPDVEESEATSAFRVLKLEPLVRMKLTSFRDKDRMHLRDLIDVGLVDGTWPSRFSPELGERLQILLDHPDG